ncbi:MAG: ABC transporter substrate-binding protein [Ruthenibacterium sp.]
MKKLLSILLVMAFVLCFVSCGASGGKATTSTQKNAGTEIQKIVYSYATFNNIPTQENLKGVEDEINSITRDKIGVEVSLRPIAISEYAQTVSLALQGGEQIDLFESLGDYNVSVSTSKAYDITNMVDSCAPEAKKTIGEEFLKACVKDGKLYGLPTLKPYALTPMVIYKQEIADELNIDMTQVKSVYDLTDILRKVKKAKPDITPLVPVQGGQSGLGNCVGDVDFLSDSYMTPNGVLIGNNLKVENFYNTEIFAKLCDLSRTWYKEGLIMQDAATTTSSAAELMSASNSFCYVAAYSYPPEDTAASLEGQVGAKIGAVQIGNAYLDTSAINALTWMVASTSKAPEAALKFLNLTFTDPEIINLLIYGIKDRDYIKDADGFVSYPSGQDAATVPYTAQLSCGTLGNFFLMDPMAGTKKESLVWEQAQNKAATKSAAMGFTFDASGVKTEYTAVNNTIERYLPGLWCGSVDPITTIPEFVKTLEASGINKIIEAKQLQLDEWKKAN